MKACEHLLEYSKTILESSSLTTEQKVVAKADIFHQSIGETANIVLLLKQQMYVWVSGLFLLYCSKCFKTITCKNT